MSLDRRKITQLQILKPPMTATLVHRIDEEHGPPCCSQTAMHTEQNNLMPEHLLLTNTIVPINVLIDIGCMQINVLSERIGTLPQADVGVNF